MLHGPRGIGKSSLAYTAFRRPWVSTSEMDPDLVQSYARRSSIQLAGSARAELRRDLDGEPIAELNAPDVGPDGLVVDSLTALGHEEATLSAVKRWCAVACAPAICVLHHTKDQLPSGTAWLLHMGDVEVAVERRDGQRTISVLKNRYGALGDLTFSLGATGVALPTRDEYYSVEGTGPYRLVSWPATTAVRHADMLRHAEKHPEGVPNKPCSVSALASALYAGGWAEPADWEARRAYSEANGVPYWSPFPDRCSPSLRRD